MIYYCNHTVPLYIFIHGVNLVVLLKFEGKLGSNVWKLVIVEAKAESNLKENWAQIYGN